MKTLTLNGEWKLSKRGEDEIIPAVVPGCVHLDLQAAEMIPDPYYRDNELDLMWIGETDWTYQRQFTVSNELLAHERITLCCHGLDTLATITLNDTQVAKTENMFRTYEFDVKPHLIEGQNSIRIDFQAAMPYVQDKQAQRRLPAWTHDKLEGGNWLRKEPCNFGWDWGPMLVTCGIWREIELVASNGPRLVDVLVLQDHDHSQGVGLEIAVQTDRVSTEDVTAKISIAFEGQTIEEITLTLSGQTIRAEMVIEQAHLWWPNGMGEQPLYDLKVDLYSASGEVLDQQTKRIGLRTLKLKRPADEWGESFHFSVNGVPFFAKGANWIPADVFARRVTSADYERLLEDAVAANMNMIRVWGGGIYEENIFYDLCDELGLCVWQDFIFACATYPTFDEDFMTNVKVEAEQNVRRIRHHACLALWCGNNELEQGLTADTWTDDAMSWEDYGLLFDELLPEVVKRLDPQRDYWPSSAHSPLGERADWNNPTCGDAHLWEVWHGWQPFEWYRTSQHRFCSEFGFQSFPKPSTVETYTAPADHNITSYIMEHHQRSRIGNSTIVHYMVDWFRLPTSFEMTLWLSQILQGMAIKYAVEHWRRNMPRSMGALYWQLNDCWQVASWSSIDYFGHWKALHHMARDFFTPVLISGVEDWETGTVDIHVTNDRQQAVSGEVVWSLYDVWGGCLAKGQIPASVPPQQNFFVEQLDMGDDLDQHGPRALMVHLDFLEDGQSLSQNTLFFGRPKHLELQTPHIQVSVQEMVDHQFQVQLDSDLPALWVWLEIEDHSVRFSKNFFHLMPGKSAKDIIITLEEALTLAEFQKQLRLRSLVDTYA
jgi:beta-mannosidase